MALRPPRIQTLARAMSGGTPQVHAVDKPVASPQLRASRPRDQAFQDRLRKSATQKAVSESAATAADCKRRSRRKAMTLPGLITFRTMRLQVPCTITDMSGSGARLVLPAGTARTYGDLEHLPDQLILVIRTDRMQVGCEIKWRRPGSLGVRFLGPPTPSPIPAR